jgi:hypothetical protein
VLVRNRLNLATKLRHPERVDDIGGFDFQADLLANRDVQLIRRDDAEVRVLELPPPLMTDDFDFDDIGTGRCGGGRGDRREGRNGNVRENEEGDDCPANFESGVSVGLSGNPVIRSPTKPNHCPEEYRLDDDKYRDRDPENQVV